MFQGAKFPFTTCFSYSPIHSAQEVQATLMQQACALQLQAELICSGTQEEWQGTKEVV